MTFNQTLTLGSSGIQLYGPYFQSDSKWQADDSHLEAGYYFAVQDSASGEVFDVAGPFDDEAECLMAMRRSS